MALKLKPLGARILVEPVSEQEVKRGGIIIPDSAKEKPTEAIVRKTFGGQHAQLNHGVRAWFPMLASGLT